MPTVSVLTAVYNAGPYLDMAIQSILNQSYQDFEFIIINDASTDGSVDYLNQITDKRVKVIHNEENIGLTRSLNKGLKYVSGKFVARMDADDVAHPERLTKQVAFLNKHSDYVLVGSSYRVIDENSIVSESIIKPMDHEELMWLFHTRTALEHGSVTYRHQMKGATAIMYDEVYRTAQDYDFWLKILRLGRGAVLSDTLLDYRVHDKNVTSTLSNQQLTNLKNIALGFLKNEYSFDSKKIAGATAVIDFLNEKKPFSLKEFTVTLTNLTDLVALYIKKHNIQQDVANFLIRRAHGQIWHCALNKRAATKLQKLVLPIKHPISFMKLLQRKKNQESFLKTKFVHENL